MRMENLSGQENVAIAEVIFGENVRRSFETPLGPLEVVTFIGQRQNQEDAAAIVINGKGCLVGIVIADGIGKTYTGKKVDGSQAARALVECQRDALVNGDVLSGPTNASLRLHTEGASAATCYIAAWLTPDRRLLTIQAGDVRARVADSDGQLKKQTKDEHTIDASGHEIKNQPANYLDSISSGTLTPNELPIAVGDWVIVGSDGFWGNVSDEELAGAIRTCKDPSDLTDKILTLIADHIQRGEGKRDNITFTILHVTR